MAQKQAGMPAVHFQQHGQSWWIDHNRSISRRWQRLNGLSLFKSLRWTKFYINHNRASSPLSFYDICFECFGIPFTRYPHPAYWQWQWLICSLSSWHRSVNYRLLHESCRLSECNQWCMFPAIHNVFEPGSHGDERWRCCHYCCCVVVADVVFDALLVFLLFGSVAAAVAFTVVDCAVFSAAVDTFGDVSFCFVVLLPFRFGS